MEMAGEPENLGLLAKIEIRKNEIYLEKHLHGMPMPVFSALWHVMHGRLNNRRGGVKKLQ